jgi:hypothetical protein
MPKGKVPKVLVLTLPLLSPVLSATHEKIVPVLGY